MKIYNIVYSFNILIYIIISVMYIIYLERKISAKIQDRHGPLETGIYGITQPIADIIKLLQKVNITPQLSYKINYFIAPAIVFFSVYMCFIEIPFIFQIKNNYSDYGIIYIYAMIGVKVYALLMAGISSNNHFSIIGSIRMLLNYISYEISIILSSISVIIINQTYNLQTICILQSSIIKQDNPILNSYIDNGIIYWNIIHYPHLIISFIIFFISSLALSNRTPFDLYEAESELVAGIYTEYGGIKWGIMFLSEYALMLLFSLLMSILFFGGWNSPFIRKNFLQNINNYFFDFFWINLKSLIIIIIIIFIRWSMPRLRIDQSMYICWNILIPISFLCVIISFILVIL
ncbi:MAG: NADH-quinone oxidoreductase subunit H [Bacteroides sp.]|nr:MAG: NADH-quinone oxidoreductase subunit H [Bacteroides sp.]